MEAQAEAGQFSREEFIAAVEKMKCVRETRWNGDRLIVEYKNGSRASVAILYEGGGWVISTYYPPVDTHAELLAQINKVGKLSF